MMNKTHAFPCTIFLKVSGKIKEIAPLMHIIVSFKKNYLFVKEMRSNFLNLEFDSVENPMQIVLSLSKKLSFLNYSLIYINVIENFAGAIKKDISEPTPSIWHISNLYKLAQENEYMDIITDNHNKIIMSFPETLGCVQYIEKKFLNNSNTNLAKHKINFGQYCSEISFNLC